MFICNNTLSKYQQKLTKLIGELDKSPVIAEQVNNFLFVIGEKSKRKSSKNTKDLSIINKFEIIGIYKTLYATTKEQEQKLYLEHVLR